MPVNDEPITYRTNNSEQIKQLIKLMTIDMYRYMKNKVPKRINSIKTNNQHIADSIYLKKRKNDDIQFKKMYSECLDLLNNINNKNPTNQEKAYDNYFMCMKNKNKTKKVKK